MNLRSNLLLCVALVTGTALAFGTKAILKSMPEEKGPKLAEPQVAAMVAKKDLIVGEEITPQNIRFERFPESGVPSDVIFHYKDAANRTLNQDVKKGKMISLYHLNDPNENRLATRTFIPLKNHYVSFVIDSIMENGNVSANPGLLDQIRKKVQAGVDKVQFLISYEKAGETDVETGKPLPRTLTTEPLIKGIDIHQIKVLQKVMDNAGTIKTALNMTFILSDEQLDLINKAAVKGKITIVVNGSNTPETNGQPILLQGTMEEEPLPPEENKSPDNGNGVENEPPEIPNETGNRPTLSISEKESPFDYHEASKVVSKKPVRQNISPVLEEKESADYQTSAVTGDDELKSKTESVEAKDDRGRDREPIDVVKNGANYFSADSSPAFSEQTSGDDSATVTVTPVSGSVTNRVEETDKGGLRMSIPRPTTDDETTFRTVSQHHSTESSEAAKLFRKPRMSVPRGNVATSDPPVDSRANP